MRITQTTLCVDYKVRVLSCALYADQGSVLLNKSLSAIILLSDNFVPFCFFLKIIYDFFSFIIRLVVTKVFRFVVVVEFYSLFVLYLTPFHRTFIVILLD